MPTVGAAQFVTPTNPMASWKQTRQTRLAYSYLLKHTTNIAVQLLLWLSWIICSWTGAHERVANDDADVWKLI